ncbi:MAG: nucleoside monophosphate kinase [Buchnera aphidicola (Kaburagia rhusicola rhusicola)]
MRIVLLGAPGSGKGTQAKFIAKRYRIPIISTGEILRKLIQNDTLISKKIKYTIHNGKLISDNIVTTLVKNSISKINCDSGFVLDGFPRTISQAQIIKKEKILINYIFELKIPNEMILKRVQKRRMNSILETIDGNIEDKNQSLKSTNYKNITHRYDDNELIINTRLEEYKKFTIPLINYFNKSSIIKKIKFYTIDGTKTISEINEEIKNILD